MALKIGSNIASLQAQRQLANSSQALNTTYQALSSGLRINKASDDSAGLAIASTLQAQARIFTQAIRNVNDGISQFNIADGAISSLSNIVTRLQELAQQSANEAYSNFQRKALDSEAQVLKKEFTRIVQSTSFNSQKLLNGESAALSLQAGVGSDAVITGSIGNNIGTATFTSSGSISAGATVIDSQSADFNNDGYLDIVTINGGLNTASILLGRGDGTFSTTVSYAAGTTVAALDLADFNGDGIVDIVTANSTSQNASVLLGRGDGTFGAATNYSITASPTSITAGDFNGDGKIDLATSHSAGSVINILQGNGDGTFAAATTVTGISLSIEIDTADFNGDGILDLVEQGNAGAVYVFIGNGNGTFASPITTNTSTGPTDMVLGDFNNDSLIDIATSNSGGTNSINILLGQGNGSFSSYVSYSAQNITSDIVVGDFNGDGNSDLVTGSSKVGGASIFIGNGNGTFSAGATISSNSSYYFVVGDFNGDSVLDLGSLTSGLSQMMLGNTSNGVSALHAFSLATMSDAKQALSIFKRKGEILNDQRGKIGAFQSRLGYTLNTLSSQTTNYLQAESRIRDVDIATESSELVRLQILQNASSAILTQANQQPSLALKLLDFA